MESSVLNLLKDSDVKDSDIEFLQKKFKGKIFNVEECDKELVKLGYEPVFFTDYDEEDEYDNEYEDDYKKIHHRKSFDD